MSSLGWHSCSGCRKHHNSNCRKRSNAALSRANPVLGASVYPRVKGCKWSSRVNIILHLWDKVHEESRLITLHNSFPVQPGIGWPHFCRPPSPVHCHLMANPGLQLPRPPGHHSLHGKIHISCQKKQKNKKQPTSSYHQWHSVPGSWGRGEAEMKCGSRGRCEQLAMFFHSAGGTANLFPCSIYGSKQDADSRIEVVCHM